MPGIGEPHFCRSAIRSNIVAHHEKQARRQMDASLKRRVHNGLVLSSGPLALLTLVACGQQPQPTPPGPAGNITGEARFVDVSDKRPSRLVFEKAARTHWHVHTDRQLLVIEEGLGLVQERGDSIRELRVGEPFNTKAGVWHWHGAAPDQGAVQLTLYGGTIEWGEAVTDEQYRGR
jgi:quercetin dioxygenase-like cupin family protein